MSDSVESSVRIISKSRMTRSSRRLMSLMLTDVLSACDSVRARIRSLGFCVRFSIPDLI